MLMKEEKVKRQHLGLTFYRYSQLVKGCPVIHVRHAVIHTLERRGRREWRGVSYARNTASFIFACTIGFYMSRVRPKASAYSSLWVRMK